MVYLHNLCVKCIFYDKIFYSDDTVDLPKENTTEFHQVKDDLVLLLDTGESLLLSIFWDNDAGFIKINSHKFSEQELKRKYAECYFLVNEKIFDISWLYRNNAYIYSVSDTFIGSDFLIGLCIFFKSGKKIAIFSGDIEFKEFPYSKELALMAPSGLLLLVFDFKSYTYLSPFPKQWL